MIFGIGTDIVSVPRMQQALERHGERVARRILTADEMEDYRRAGQPAAFIAKRFAAKEAAVKALGLGFSEGISMRNIGVEHDPRGKPLLVLSGRALELAQQMGVGEAFLSLADERDHALAFVTLLKQTAQV
jgi:holo-[acyl-carrier protein] synthase